MRLFPEEAWAIATIWQEARGEPQQGRVAVAEVIRNRMRQLYQSDGSIVGTVLRPYQFSGWNTRDPNRMPAAKLNDSDPQVAACMNAWNEAQGGSNVALGALLYYAPASVPTPPDWARAGRCVAVLGRHEFYLP